MIHPEPRESMAVLAIVLALLFLGACVFGLAIALAGGAL